MNGQTGQRIGGEPGLLGPISYDLDNPYLTANEKLEVELWFQFPGNAMNFAFFCCALWRAFHPMPWTMLIGIPLATQLVVAIPNWYVYSKRLVWCTHMTVLHNWSLWLLATAAIVALIFRGQYLLAAIVLLVKLGAAISVAEIPYMSLYAILSRKTRMHPKYAFFKRFYGHIFPFERTGDE